MRLLTALALWSVLGVGATQAQFPLPMPARRPADTTTAADTIDIPAFRIEPPISPLGALGRSILLPGWGQSVLGRRVTGAFFVFWEGIAVTMTIKAAHQLDYLEEIGAEGRAEGKRQEIQDWLVLLAFNHLLAGAEAFVSAQLWDFPVELEARRLASGAGGLGVRITP